MAAMNKKVSCGLVAILLLAATGCSPSVANKPDDASDRVDYSFEIGGATSGRR